MALPPRRGSRWLRRPGRLQQEGRLGDDRTRRDGKAQRPRGRPRRRSRRSRSRRRIRPGHGRLGWPEKTTPLLVGKLAVGLQGSAAVGQPGSRRKIEAPAWHPDSVVECLRQMKPAVTARLLRGRDELGVLSAGRKGEEQRRQGQPVQIGIGLIHAASHQGGLGRAEKRPIAPDQATFGTAPGRHLGGRERCPASRIWDSIAHRKMVGVSTIPSVPALTDSSSATLSGSADITARSWSTSGGSGASLGSAKCSNTRTIRSATANPTATHCRVPTATASAAIERPRPICTATKTPRTTPAPNQCRWMTSHTVSTAAARTMAVLVIETTRASPSSDSFMPRPRHAAGRPLCEPPAPAGAGEP